MQNFLKKSPWVRKSFRSDSLPAIMPKQSNIQKNNYDSFLSRFIHPEFNENLYYYSNPDTIEKVFQKHFPITFTSSAKLNKEDVKSYMQEDYISAHYVRYYIGNPTNTIEQCKQLKLDYTAPLAVEISFTQGISHEDKSIPDGFISTNIELDNLIVQFGRIPLMTANGSFIINGIEKTLVSQLQRPDGFFPFHDEHDQSINSITKGISLIPMQGKSIDLGIDLDQNPYVKLGTSKKLFPMAFFLRIIGIEKADLLKSLYSHTIFSKSKSNDLWANTSPVKQKHFSSIFLRDLLKDINTNINIHTNNQIIGNTKYFYNLHIDNSLSKLEDLIGKYVFSNIIIDNSTKSVIAYPGDVLDENHVAYIRAHSIQTIELISINSVNKGPKWKHLLFNDIDKYFGFSIEKLDSLLQSYLGVSDDYTKQTSRNVREFQRSLINSENYFFSNYALNEFHLRLGHGKEDNYLKSKDLLIIIRLLEVFLSSSTKSFLYKSLLNSMNRDYRYPVNLTKQIEDVLDSSFNKIKHLAFARFRQLKHISKNKENKKKQLAALFKTSIVLQSFKELFNSSSLGQFLDNTNALAEVTHLRRMTFLGSGGLTANTATFKDRDINFSYYGKLCPIETPEGKNVGLVNSLVSHSLVGRDGFIFTPFILVKNGMITTQIHYLSQQEERVRKIAFASEQKKIDLNQTDLIMCRYMGNFIHLSSNEVEYVEASPRQIISLSSCLIPFLEHNDASRALMGSNMQRQAVPLLGSKPPLSGTGLESYFSHESRNNTTLSQGINILFNSTGNRKSYVSLNKNKNNTSIPRGYGLEFLATGSVEKLHPSNQKTSIYYHNEVLNKNSLILNGTNILHNNSTENSEISLGKDILVAFMSFNGNSFEDSIVLSERVLEEGYFTSLHTETIESSISSNPFESERFTQEIPGISPNQTMNLDLDGIVKLGSSLAPGDIIIGKVKTITTNSSDTNLEVEENFPSLIKRSGLLKTIFKNQKVKTKHQDIDASSIMKTNKRGKVIEVRKHYQNNVSFYSQFNSVISFEDIINLMSCKHQLTNNYIRKVIIWEQSRLNISESKMATGYFNRLDELRRSFIRKIDYLKKIQRILSKIYLIKCLHSLKRFSNRSLKSVEVIVAKRSYLRSGDKLTGRHGNKGVISRILKKEDMPYTKDGRIIDVILNPMGISSRMNLGQIYETHMGWWSDNLAGKVSNLRKSDADYMNQQGLKSFINYLYQDSLGHGETLKLNSSELAVMGDKMNYGVPTQIKSFDSISMDEITKLFQSINLYPTGQTTLYDGPTGIPFDRKVTIGNMHVLKLNHLVEEKLHVRTTGPYHLITQQPLGGKSKKGGQRLGEMEVWALQGYGSAHNLREMVTIKSDSLHGRSSLSNNISNENINNRVGTPEAFYVLIKELESLGLKMKVR